MESAIRLQPSIGHLSIRIQSEISQMTAQSKDSAAPMMSLDVGRPLSGALGTKPCSVMQWKPQDIGEGHILLLKRAAAHMLSHCAGLLHIESKASGIMMRMRC